MLGYVDTKLREPENKKVRSRLALAAIQRPGRMYEPRRSANRQDTQGNLHVQKLRDLCLGFAHFHQPEACPPILRGSVMSEPDSWADCPLSLTSCNVVLKHNKDLPVLYTQWRAAGVLVYEFDEAGEMKLLLARQDNKERGAGSKHRAWNILGELQSAMASYLW